jgi:hypothetical protein
MQSYASASYSRNDHSAYLPGATLPYLGPHCPTWGHTALPGATLPCP